MARIGSLYKVVRLANPSSMFPSRLFPVFQESGKNSVCGEYFRQIVDENGIITDFVLFSNPDLTSTIEYKGKPIFSGIHAEEVCIYAISEDSIHLSVGRGDFLAQLRALLNESREVFETNVLAGVELSHYLQAETEEAYFAVSVVRQVAAVSLETARGWILRAPLSKFAREKGEIALLEIISTSSIDDEAIPDIRTVRYSDHAFAQGDFAHELSDGRIAVRDGKKIYIGSPAVRKPDPAAFDDEFSVDFG